MKQIRLKNKIIKIDSCVDCPFNVQFLCDGLCENLDRSVSKVCIKCPLEDD